MTVVDPQPEILAFVLVPYRDRFQENKNNRHPLTSEREKNWCAPILVHLDKPK